MRAPLFTLLLLALATDARSAPAGGTVTGKVVLVGDRKTRTLEDAWVYLEPEHRARHAARPTPEPRQIRQQGRKFVPNVLVVPVGTTVAFPNYDREEHNVFSPTDPPGLPDLGRYNTDHRGKSWTLDDPAEIAVFCDIHPWMFAYVKVVDADPALIAQVGKDGRYTVPAVPPGTYTVHAWTYASTESIETITVGDGATVEVPELHVQLGPIKAHLRKDGSPYQPYPK
ncbi:MAG: hypothetical protein ACM31C_23825 [Acidobacteriota bacterium]